ncbi:hypothetical protein SAMN05421823_10991 [Catalinimonas alkaloidigena]|uniref:Uncharacterized protein n=1 Tax=Catalinimonas alkaloidigena TaxID=1075417 RepID=A0A1G9P7M9_9BACT|nr:hypothetical protein [Catalinimonas alkaloidigena]SDL94175.1 hypothetical protein SAMN05421823_10991 [Catalinimonas alkaloidigena]
MYQLSVGLKKQVIGALIRQKQEELYAMQGFQHQQLVAVSDQNQDSLQLVESPLEETMQSLELYTRSMDQLSREIALLQEIDPDVWHDQIRYGSLVKLQQVLLLVAVPATRHRIQQFDVYGVSLESPIYRALEGLLPSDRCYFGGIDYFIEDIL